MRTPRRAIKQTFPTHTWQENRAHFRQIQTQSWDTPAAPPGKPRGALHTCVPGTQFEEDPRFTKAFTCLNPCFQWSSGYRMPSEPNQSGSGEWLLRM